VKKSRILVVDDNPANLRLACDVLEFDGFEVVSAVNAEQALASLEVELPDLLLTDIEMPGMDGLELTRLLRASPPTRQLPIVALTAYAMRGDEEKALAAGCDAYFTKPVDTRTLGARLAAILEVGVKGKGQP